ncbi:hypothetical protein B0H12DRAFT_476281 [Mycena haematopus]|nr:hypothetical protein B0H12DRAFT_476281 [Mycena haematopus]
MALVHLTRFGGSPVPYILVASASYFCSQAEGPTRFLYSLDKACAMTAQFMPRVFSWTAATRILRNNGKFSHLIYTKNVLRRDCSQFPPAHNSKLHATPFPSPHPHQEGFNICFRRRSVADFLPVTCVLDVSLLLGTFCPIILDLLPLLGGSTLHSGRSSQNSSCKTEFPSISQKRMKALEGRTRRIVFTSRSFREAKGRLDVGLDLGSDLASPVQWRPWLRAFCSAFVPDLVSSAH